MTLAVAGDIFRAMFNYESVQNQEIWDKSLEAWKEQACELGDEGVFLAQDVERTLNWLRQQADKEKNSHGYFLVPSGEKIASSVVEFSHAMPQSKKPWLKLLNIWLAPKFLPTDNGEEEIDIEGLKEVLGVLAASIMFAVKLTYDELPSAELKIFGRTSHMRQLFTNVILASEIEGAFDKAGLKARIEGKWLCIAKK